MTRTASADLAGLTIDRDHGSPPNGRRRLLLSLGGIVALAALAVMAWQMLRPERFDVRVVEAKALGGSRSASGEAILTANGYVVARQRASVSTEIAGRLEALYVEEGSRVERGQVMGVLRNADQRAEVDAARAALRAAEAEEAEQRAAARESELARVRAEALLKQELVSQAEYDAAEARAHVDQARIESAAADRESARARLETVEVALEKTYIRAPFKGVVLRKEAEVGEIVSPIPSSGGLTRGAIVTMADFATLEVEVDVNEGYVARVGEGMRGLIALDAYPAERYPGRVRQIVPTADRQKATVMVKIAFDSLDARVLPEMGAKVTFLDDAGSTRVGAGGTASIVLPRTSIAEREGTPVVFVVEDGRAAMRRVSPRPQGPDWVVIAGGVMPGERAVVNPPDGLTDNARVRIR